MNSYKVSGKLLIDGQEIKIKDEDAITCYAVDSKQADKIVENHLLDKYDGKNLEWVVKHTILTQVGRKE